MPNIIPTSIPTKQQCLEAAAQHVRLQKDGNVQYWLFQMHGSNARRTSGRASAAQAGALVIAAEMRGRYATTALLRASELIPHGTPNRNELVRDRALQLLRAGWLPWLIGADRELAEDLSETVPVVWWSEQ